MAAQFTVPTVVVVLPPALIVGVVTWWLTRLVIKHIAHPWVDRREEKALARLYREGFDR